LASALVAELQEQMGDEGAAAAIDFCATRALDLTAEVSRETGADIKRTSTRTRNPVNRPDSLERVALAYFQGHLDRGEPLPADWVQPGPGDSVRYYRPLLVAEFCTVCHGAAGALDAGVVEALASRYPSDEAVGYAEGDFRGLIRVQLPLASVSR